MKVYQKRDSVDPEVFGVRSTAMTLALGAARPMDASGPHAMTMLRTLRPSLMRFLFVKNLVFLQLFWQNQYMGEYVFESQFSVSFCSLRYKIKIISFAGQPTVLR